MSGSELLSSNLEMVTVSDTAFGSSLGIFGIQGSVAELFVT